MGSKNDGHVSARSKAGHKAHGRVVETTGCLVQVFSDGVKPYVTPTVRSEGEEESEGLKGSASERASDRKRRRRKGIVGGSVP